jgi:hypothetical protein
MMISEAFEASYVAVTGNYEAVDFEGVMLLEDVE